MVIPEYIREVTQALKNDERISRKRSEYVNKFCGLLHIRAKNLRLKDSHLPVIRKMYEYGIQLLEERILMSCVRSQSEDIKPYKLEHNIRLTEFNFMCKFKEELETEESPDYDDLVYSRSAAEGPHPINSVLSTHSRELIQTLNIVGTTVLDELVKHDVITDSDEEVIASGHTREDQNRHLLAVLSTSPPEKDLGCFVDFLQVNHKPLGTKFAETVREYASEPPDQICAACTVITLVDPGRIAKVMFEKRNIPSNFYRDLVSPHLSTEKKWKLIKKKGLEEEAILALRPKYDHFFFMFKGVRDLTCTCKDSEIDIPSPLMNRTSSKNSGPSSFRGWSAKNSGKEEMNNVLAELRHMRSSLDDLRRTVDYQREPSGRPASLPDIGWPHYRQGSSGGVPGPAVYNDYASPYIFPRAGDTRLKPKEKNNLFKKIKKKFMSKDRRHFIVN